MMSLRACVTMFGLLIVTANTASPFFAESTFILRIGTDKHQCVAENPQNMVSSVECPANSACFLMNNIPCLTTEINLGDTCQSDKGCFCGRHQPADMGGATYARTACLKDEKCQQNADLDFYFCGYKAVENNQKCADAKFCTYMRVSAKNRVIEIRCPEKKYGYQRDNLNGCFDKPVIKLDDTCSNDEGCMCDNGVVEGPQFVVPVAKGSVCASHNSYPKEASKIVALGEACGKDDKACYCKHANDVNLSVVCPPESTCMAMSSGSPGCKPDKIKRVASSQVCADGACLCTRDGKEPKDPKQEIMIGNGVMCDQFWKGSLIGYNTKIGEGTTCMSNHNCFCELQKEGSVLCPYKTTCIVRRQDGQSACVDLNVNRGKKCEAGECDCYNPVTFVRNICKTGQYCSDNGLCAAATISPSEQCKDLKGCMCLGKEDPLDPTRKEASHCNPYENCEAAPSNGKPICMTTFGKDKDTEMWKELFTCRLDVGGGNLEEITCGKGSYCRLVNGKPACVANRITQGVKCDQEGGCICARRGQKTNYALCEKEEYCYSASRIEGSSCVKQAVEQRQPCADPASCFFVVTGPKSPEGVFVTEAIRCPQNTIGHCFSPLDPRCGCFPAYKADQVATITTPNPLKRVFVEVGGKHEFVECRQAEKVIIQASTNKLDCESTGPTTIRPNHYCFNRKDNCVCETEVQQKPEKNAKPTSKKITEKLVAGEFCSQKGESLKGVAGARKYIECPKDLPCYCTAMIPHNKDEYCHIGGGTVAGNSFTDTPPKEAFPALVYQKEAFRMDELAQAMLFASGAALKSDNPWTNIKYIV